MDQRNSNSIAYCKNINSPDNLIMAFTSHLNKQYHAPGFVCLTHKFAPQAFGLISKTEHDREIYTKFVKDSETMSLSALKDFWLIKPVLGISQLPDYVIIAPKQTLSGIEELEVELLQLQNIYSGLINTMELTDRTAKDSGAGLISQLTHDINSMIIYLQDIHLSTLLEKKIAYLDILVPKLLLFIRELELSYTKLNLNDLITSIVELNEPDRIELIPLPVEKHLSCDVELINMALSAIISNAYQAASNAKSRVNITVDVIESNSPWHDIAWSKITIMDKFTGIPADFLAMAFRPLFTTKKNVGHPGLGLSLARKIIRAHGGIIELTNNSEGGLTVDCYLPLEN